MVDRDRQRFDAAVLLQWKRDAEQAAAAALSIVAEYRAIAAAEIRTELSRAEYLSLCELGKELDCAVTNTVAVPLLGGGFVNLHAAAVHGDALLAVELREFAGDGFPFFQIEYLIELLQKVRFAHFTGVELWVLVASTAPSESEVLVLARLTEMAETAPFSVFHRLYRVADLEVQLMS